MRSKKTYIVLIIILLVFFVVMFLLFGIDNLRKENAKTVIVVGDDSVFVLEKESWINLVGSYSDLNWDKYNVYVDNEKIGNYYLWNDDKWYVFDDKKNPINIDGNLLGIRSSYKTDVYKFREEEVTDSTYINKVLENNKLDINTSFTSKYKVSIDFDNDLEIEDFYVISNAFTTDRVDNIFSIVFMVKNEEIYPIYTDIQSNSSLNGCKPYFNSFLNIDEDDNYEFIIGCGGYSISSTTNMLYKFKDNKFKIIVSN